MTASTTRRRWAILVAVAILAGNSFVLYSSIMAIRDASRWIRESVAFRQTLSDVLIELLNAETGQRGFLIKGDQLYLAPYYLASENLGQTLDRLDGFARPGHGDPADIANIRTLAEAKFAELKATIEQYRDGTAASAIPLERGKFMMDELRASIAAVRADAEAVLAEQQEDYFRSQYTAWIALIVFIFGGLALLLTIYLSGRREIERRTADGNRIADYARTLDQSVTALKRERHEIRQLNEASNYLQSCNSLSEVAAVVSPLMERMFAGHRGGLYVYAASRNQLDRVAVWGGFEDCSFILATDCWGLRRGQVHEYLPDAGNPVCSHLQHDVADGDHGTICLPLLAHGETLGLLTIIAGAVDGDDGQLQSLIASARMLARQLSLTLANMRLRETLNDQSIRDPLTNAFNRRYLQLMAQNETAQARRFGRCFVVAMIDIDHFKRFNDIHGHSAGDAALVLVASHLQRSIREIDWLVRYGGEEFLLILHETAAADGEARLRELVRGVSELPLRTDGIVLPNVTISVGAAVFPDDGTDFDALVRQADEALYEVKNSGRNHVRFAGSARETAAD